MTLVSKTSLLVEKVKRQAPKDVKTFVLGDNFAQQTAFINDPARFLDAQCSRRAGKSSGLGRKFIRSMEKYPKGQAIYLGLTIESAHEIMWPVFQELNDTHNLGLTFLESKHVIRHPNGSTIKLVGADQKNFTKRLKGRKYIAVGIDEAQDFGIHLQDLIDTVLTPAISDYQDSWLALTGTPGPVPQGYFFDVTCNKKYGFSHHEWTLLDNPHMPDPEAFIADLIKRREWQPNNPTLLREYRNQWVLDVDSLWIKYSEKTNHYDELPTGHKWNYILGVDIGYNDADAVAVIAWSETSKVTYLVEESIIRKQGISGMTTQIENLQKKYNAYKIVMDEGALGKKIAEDLTQRFGVPLVAADKTKKQTNVELLNDSMRLGNFKAKANSRFAKESYLIQIDWSKTTPNRIVLKKNFHSDIIDAVLYGFKESYAYAHTPPPPPKAAWGSKEWAEQQTDNMFELELEGALKDQEDKKWNYE